MKPFEWLDRGFVYGPYYTLCLTTKDFHAACAHLKLAPKLIPSMMKSSTSGATTSFFNDEEGKQCAIVTLGDWKDKTGIQIAGMLCHEAVHIFQAWCDRVGEVSPSDEFEAWSIQWLSQQLMWEFNRQTQGA